MNQVPWERLPSPDRYFKVPCLTFDMSGWSLGTVTGTTPSLCHPCRKQRECTWHFGPPGSAIDSWAAVPELSFRVFVAADHPLNPKIN
jgi:hypothetical protein